MKKFLFTLATLLMAGSVYAANVYVPDTEFTADQIGTQQLLPLYVELDNEYINGWDFSFTYPEGVTAGNPKKNTAVLNQMIPNADGDEEVVTPLGDCTASNIVQAYGTAGYWDPDDDGEFESYGAVKIGPTGTFKLYDLRVTPNEGFTGGEIVITWMVSGGFDNRNGQTKVQVEGETIVALTVEGGPVVPEVTEKPVITVVDDPEAETVTVTATGNGHICLYWDDMLQAEGDGVAEWVIPYGDEEEEYGISATAQEDGKEVSEYALATVVVPAKTVVPPAPVDLEGEIIVSEPTEDGIVTVTYTGTEDVTVTVTVNGEVVEGDIQLQEGENEIVVTVEGEGYNTMTETFTVTWTAPEPPVEYTEAPVIDVEVTDDAYIITAIGDGEVVLYVDEVEVENPYTIARPEAGEDPIVVYVYATAQEPGKEIGTSDVERIEVEPKAGDTPVDPTEVGVWIVTIKENGDEVWKELLLDNDDYTGIVRFEYEDYGTFPYDPTLSEDENNAMRPNVKYYIVIDGVRYGALEDGTLTVLGEALYNPLYEGENNYVLENASGRVYNMGVAIDKETGNMYVYAAVAYYTDVEEMNAAKTVASVRYYNMAGQEMTKAEGMTIKVTTYTDGTTSAVKVMK